jgi:hypothetical protein
MKMLAELVLLATKQNLPTPKYMTVSDGDPYKQVNLTLHTRADLDAWNAATGGCSVTAMEPSRDQADVLLSTMYGGLFMGWTVNLNVRVPLSLPGGLLAALGEAARSDAEAVVSADADTIKAETLAEPKVKHGLSAAHYVGDGIRRLCLCGESFHGRDWDAADAKLSAHVEKVTGPLVEVQPDAEAVPSRTTCGHTYIGNVGEFTCDRYAPHPGQHWNSLAEFGWAYGEAVDRG